MTRLVVRKPMLRTLPRRRAVHATLLAALLFLIGDLALGLAWADDGAHDAPQAPPAVFGTAAPALGDAGVYAERWRDVAADGRERSGERGPLFSWAWTGQGQGLDREGRPVRYQIGNLTGGEHALFDVATGRLVAGYDRHESNRTTQQAYAGSPLATTDQRAHRHEEIRFLGPHDHHPEASCGLFHPLQGAHLTLDGSLQLFAHCRLGDYDGLSGPGPFPAFYPVRAERLGEHETVVFRMHDAPPPSHHNPLRDDTYSVTVWLAADIAYPLRIEVARLDNGNGHLAVSIIELVSFRAGKTPLDRSAPDVRAAPPLAFAPMQPWGIDDTGVDHPFPLSVAYQKARDDPDYGALRTYLAGHPEAFTASAAYAEFERDRAITRRWTVTVADASSHLEFCSYQYVDAVWSNLVPPSLLDPVPRGPATYDTETCDWIGKPSDPAQMPTRLPTARSLLARAQAYMAAHGIEGKANAYDLFMCGSDCGMAPPSIHAGLARHHMTQHADGEVPWLSDEQAWHQAALQVGPDGETWRFRWSVQNDTSRFGGPAPGTPQPAPGAPSLQDMGATVVPRWTMPAAQALLGMGTVAVTAGVAYYLLPLAKGLPAGLFSRVQTAKAYDHPQRRRIETLLSHEPGLHLAKIARRLDLSRRATRHHLEQLETAGLVIRRKGPRYTCYFLGGSTDRRVMDAAPLLQSEGAHAVLAAVVADPDASLTTLAARTRLSLPTVHHHVARLQEAGLVARTRDGRSVRHRATEAGRLALA